MLCVCVSNSTLVGGNAGDAVGRRQRHHGLPTLGFGAQVSNRYMTFLSFVSRIVLCVCGCFLSIRGVAGVPADSWENTLYNIHVSWIQWMEQAHLSRFRRTRQTCKLAQTCVVCLPIRVFIVSYSHNHALIYTIRLFSLPFFFMLTLCLRCIALFPTGATGRTIQAPARASAKRQPDSGGEEGIR